MNRLFTLTLALLFVGAGVFAQQQDHDPKAKTILDKLSKDMKSYKSISISFKSSIKGEGINESSTGKAGIKGDSYFYADDNQKMWSDGSQVWSLEDGDDVCYVSDADDDESGLSPKKMLTIWEDGFKYKYIGETEKNSIKMDRIKLFPNNPKKSKYHTVELLINKAKNRIHSVKIKTRDGLTISYTLTKFTPNVEFSSSKFKFDKSKHPGVEIEEL